MENQNSYSKNISGKELQKDYDAFLFFPKNEFLQIEFPIADDRQLCRFNNVLSAIDDDIKNERYSHKEKLISLITNFSTQLENNIAKLSLYNVEPTEVELQLESHPISYSILVFRKNLEALQRRASLIKTDFPSTEAIIKSAHSTETKEFEPG